MYWNVATAGLPPHTGAGRLARRTVTVGRGTVVMSVAAAVSSGTPLQLELAVTCTACSRHLPSQHACFDAMIQSSSFRATQELPAQPVMVCSSHAPVLKCEACQLLQHLSAMQAFRF